MARNLFLEAYARRYDFDRMSVKSRVIIGHYRLSSGWSHTKLAHVDDMDVFITSTGCRQVRNRGSVVYTFGPA